MTGVRDPAGRAGAAGALLAAALLFALPCAAADDSVIAHRTNFSPAIGFAALAATLLAGGLLRALLGRLAGSAIVGAAVGLYVWAISGALLIALLAGWIVFMFSLWSRARPGGYHGRASAGGSGGDYVRRRGGASGRW